MIDYYRMNRLCLTNSREAVSGFLGVNVSWKNPALRLKGGRNGSFGGVNIGI
jgi:hypothetical protein